MPQCEGLRAIYLKAFGCCQGCKSIVRIEAYRIDGLFSKFICAIHYQQQYTFQKIYFAMGANQCCAGIGGNEDDRGLQYEFGEDKNEANVQHTDTIETSDQACKFFLLDCEERLKLSSRLYKDPTLNSEPLILKQSNETDEIKCVFNRPYLFLKEKRGKKYKIFDQQSATYSDICLNHEALQYFSMLLCFLADKPHLVKDIILTEPNTYGIHAVGMYVHGVKRHIFIDDYTLCYKEKPIFSQPVRGVYMWTSLIEKAWLKVRGYASNRILVTSPAQVFQHFLQYPLGVYNLASMQIQVFNKLKKNMMVKSDNSFIVTSKKQPTHKIGLSGRKSFYLRTFFEFQGRTYYYMRNPCGSFDFRGFHRIMPPQLEAKIKKQTGEAAIVEGNFVLEEEEFLEQMEQLLIIFYNKNSTVISEQELRPKVNEEFYVQIVLQHEEELNISYVQEQKEGDFPFNPLTYQVISVNDKDSRIISGTTNEDGCFGIRSTNLLENTYQKLPPGEYLIRLKKKKNMKSNVPNGYEAADKIVITASRKIRMNYSLNEIYHAKFIQFLIEYAMKKKMGESRFKGKEIEHGSFWLGDLAIIYIKKTDKSKVKMSLEVSFPDRLNLECISHPLNNQFTAISFNEEHMLIIFEKIDLTEETFLGKYFIETF